MKSRIDYDELVKSFRIRLCERIDLKLNKAEEFILEGMTFELLTTVLTEIQRNMECGTTTTQESPITGPALGNTTSATKKGG